MLESSSHKLECTTMAPWEGMAALGARVIITEMGSKSKTDTTALYIERRVSHVFSVR